MLSPFGKPLLHGFLVRKAEKTHGTGRRIEGFSREGARVVITGRNQKTLDDAVKLIGKDVLAVRSDVSRPDDLDKLKRFRDLGAVRVNVSLMSEAPDDILPILDKWAGYIRQLRD